MLKFDGCYSDYEDDKYGTFANWDVVITVLSLSGSVDMLKFIGCNSDYTDDKYGIRSPSEALL